MFSPKRVGRQDTRRLTSRPDTLTDARPSCGVPGLAKSIPARIFMRVVTALSITFGNRKSSTNMPSTRVRMRIMDCSGSKWMSLAPELIALEISCATRRITGASAVLEPDWLSICSSDWAPSRTFSSKALPIDSWMVSSNL